MSVKTFFGSRIGTFVFDGLDELVGTAHGGQILLCSGRQVAPRPPFGNCSKSGALPDEVIDTGIGEKKSQEYPYE